jgi:hypothetical protein
MSAPAAVAMTRRLPVLSKVTLPPLPASLLKRVTAFTGRADAVKLATSQAQKLGVAYVLAAR